jgi:hypothetical protein
MSSPLIAFVIPYEDPRSSGFLPRGVIDRAMGVRLTTAAAHRAPAPSAAASRSVDVQQDFAADCVRQGVDPAGGLNNEHSSST